MYHSHLHAKALQAGLWLEIISNSYFKNPMISKKFKNEITKNVEQPSKIDRARLA